MTIDSINSPGAAGARAATTPTSGTGSASEQRFLKLLVTQLNNQDPLNPMDNAQLTSQLAQMSTVTGIEKLNTAFQAMLDQSGSSQVLQSASMIGRTVLVPGNGLTLREGSDVPFAIDMPQSADSVTVTVTDSAGNTVRTFALGALPQGVKTLAWDGLSDAGAAVANGSYSASVVARTGQAQVAATALTYSSVTSVSQGTGGVALELASGSKAALTAVRLIL